jgi:protein-tyrosine phosphatase
MIDLHAHVLPGIDDGPSTLDEAVRMCALAWQDGIRVIVATPHQHHDMWPNEDGAPLEALRQELVAACPDGPEIVLGAELRADSELLEALEARPAGGLLSIAGSRYLLLEFPSLDVGLDPFFFVHELRLAGKVPVLAHPERIPWLAGQPELLLELGERGALIQITAMSLTGELGRVPRVCCELLLDEGQVHFLATDAHDLVNRPPLLSSARAAVEQGWGAEVATRLTVDNPRAVLEDRPLADRTLQ